MPDDNFDELQTLLRLKRYEQPPPEYFQSFLHEFHRRQRAELLRQPLWRIAWERTVAFFAEQTASRYAYSAAVAAVLLCAGITSMNFLKPNDRDLQPPSIAAAQSARLDLDNRPRAHLPDYFKEFSSRKTASVASLHPRYVMDTRPVSYEPSSSF